MSGRYVSTHEVQRVRAGLPVWFESCSSRAVSWACHGPDWLPGVVRCLPLNLAHGALRLWIASGYGGLPPCKRSETAPVLSSSHTSANPAGLAHDAGNGARVTPERPGAP